MVAWKGTFEPLETRHEAFRGNGLQPVSYCNRQYVEIPQTFDISTLHSTDANTLSKRTLSFQQVFQYICAVAWQSRNGQLRLSHQPMYPCQAHSCLKRIFRKYAALFTGCSQRCDEGGERGFGCICAVGRLSLRAMRGQLCFRSRGDRKT